MQNCSPGAEIQGYIWPRPGTLALFRDWFEIRFCDLVEDLGPEELKHHDVDKAFEEQVRQTLQDSPRP